MVKVLLQEHMEVMVREAIEGVTHATMKIADQMDEFKEEL